MRDRISAMIWLLFKAGQKLSRFEHSNSEIASSACCSEFWFDSWEVEFAIAIELSDCVIFAISRIC